MNDKHLVSLIVSLYDVRRQKADLEKVEKAALEVLKPLVDPKFDALPDQPIVAADVYLKRTSGENRTISADLLLERGVAPDIIRYATKTTNYFRYVTNRPGDKVRVKEAA